MTDSVHQSACDNGWPSALIRTMRPHQWVKNLLVLAPMFFGQALQSWVLVARGLSAVVLFSVMAGTVYIINDIVDRERDRRHPTKRHRPIASGALSVRTASIAAWASGGGSLFGAALLDWRLVVVLVIYLISNLAYSNVLKQWAFVDVGVIALGFVLRVLAGSFAVGVFVSEWLVLCTFLLACFLGLGKRCHELIICRAGKLDAPRRAWQGFDVDALRAILMGVGVVTLVAYGSYTLTASLPDQPLRTHQTPFATPLLPVTIPFVALGLVRFLILVQHPSPVSPTQRMLRDRISWMAVIGWLSALTAVVAL